jgi:hypothetical protein
MTELASDVGEEVQDSDSDTGESDEEHNNKTAATVRRSALHERVSVHISLCVVVYSGLSDCDHTRFALTRGQDFAKAVFVGAEAAQAWSAYVAEQRDGPPPQPGTRRLIQPCESSTGEFCLMI